MMGSVMLAKIFKKIYEGVTFIYTQTFWEYALSVSQQIA